MGGVLRFAALLLAVLSLLLASCASGISEEEAEAIAADFVRERVKFFTREENATFEVPAYTFDSVITATEGSNYVVSFTVSAQLGNDTKSADLAVTVSPKGEVINLQRLQNE